MGQELGCAGEVSPKETWERLRQEPSALLVDVRTHAEWVYVGVPDLGGVGRRLATVSWQLYPSMSRNPGFESQLRAAGARPDDALFLICRSGVRSLAAARHLTAAGWRQCFNVRDGFEGQLDGAKRRGVGGWKAAGLPWLQG